jgi:translation initiation factor IF-1
MTEQMQSPGRPKIRVADEVVRVELTPYEPTRGRIIWRYG